MMFRSRLLTAVSTLALSASLTFAGSVPLMLSTTTIVEAAVVSRIAVRGNSRVDEATIVNSLTIAPGRSFGTDDVNESVKRLFATGLFSDVQIRTSGGTLTVTVEENQVVNQVIFNGNRKIKDAQLKSLVQTTTLGPYNELILASDIEIIKDAYSGVGRDSASVTTQVVPLGNGRVNVAFEINEGDRTRISRINFVGNNAFSDSRLANVVSTKRSSLLNFLSRNDIYDEDKLLADEELLRRFYHDRGYADFRISSSFADLDVEKNEYEVTFSVDEGERYNFGAVNVDSTIPGINAEELQKVIKSKQGKTYSASDVEDTITAIADTVAAQGYPFAQITPRGDRDFTNQTISVDYLVDEGTRAYIERIEIVGNTRTRDYVVRREFDISEGDPYNQVLVHKATKRLNALGYFSSVNITTRPGSEADRVILVVNVKDKPTGEFGIGGGYSNSGGFSADLSITESNFLGRGQFIRLSTGRGEETQNYSLSFTEPYFLGYRLSAGFDIFQNEDTSGTGYDVKTQGGALRIAAPLTDYLTLSGSYNYSKNQYSNISTVTSAPEAAVVGRGDRTTSSIKIALAYSNVDDSTFPREGVRFRLEQEFAGLGGDVDFIKTTGKFSYFDVISEAIDLVGSVKVGGGYVQATSGNLDVFDQIYLGSETIRGFDSNGIGPRTFNGTTNVAAVGGTTYFNASAEVSAPAPIFPESLGLRVNAFVDTATLYGNDIAAADFGTQTLTGSDMSWRASVGAGVIWASPFGPLSFYYAEPVVKESFDDVRKFGFGAATRF